MLWSWIPEEFRVRFSTLKSRPTLLQRQQQQRRPRDLPLYLESLRPPLQKPCPSRRPPRATALLAAAFRNCRPRRATGSSASSLFHDRSSVLRLQATMGSTLCRQWRSSRGREGSVSSRKALALLRFRSCQKPRVEREISSWPLCLSKISLIFFVFLFWQFYE